MGKLFWFMGMGMIDNDRKGKEGENQNPARLLALPLGISQWKRA
jgi:hypothetical protein